MSEAKVNKVNKMKIAVVSLACALVLAIGGMIGIYAASQQSVGASFTVNYSVGDNVAIAVGANIRGPYSTGSEKGYDWFSQSGTLETNENGLFILNAAEQNDNNLQLSYPDINMTPDGIYPVAIMAFYFENIGEGTIQAVFTNKSDIKNMSITYWLEPIVISEDDPEKDIAHVNHFPGMNVIELDENNSYTFEIQEGQIMCLAMVSVVANQNKNAHYISEGENGISFSFTKVEEN